ncbi:Ig-like domain repeat protein [Shouchella lehensis]|uniref:Ig-like domain-containing protein n=1 Tax=Shouchella lehensis G1 TaxID=1246626 RepID=A0A060M7Q3_9BACI|nr:Ig-like domain repeat protein [Shouchella lehensis]AIC96089.1 hypothetical protein BleG1_3542 [Shouchella lehensis G1]
MKKACSLFVAVIVFLLFMPYSFASSDVNPPILHSVVLEKNDMQVGERNAFTMEITDDISGVDYVSVNLSSSSGDQMMAVSAKQQENNQWIAEFSFEEYAEGGEWYVHSILVRDKADNSKFYRNGVDINLRFNLDNPNSDVTPPKLHSIELEKNEMRVGERNLFTMKITDDISGVDYVSVNLSSSSGEQTMGISAQQQENDQWIAEFDFGEYAESGEWYVHSILVGDKAGNSKFYLNEVDINLRFNLDNSNSDVTPPELHSIELEKNEMRVGEGNTFTMEITDDISGVDYVSVNLSSSSGDQMMAVSAQRQENDRWIAEFSFGKYAESGEWYVHSISVGDKAGNSKFYWDRVDFNVRFDVKQSPD